MATTAKLWSRLSAAQANKITPRVVASGQGAYLTIGGEPKLNFCSSHYLGFAEEPRLKRAEMDQAVRCYYHSGAFGVEKKKPTGKKK